MYTQFFGNYLLSNSYITKEQLFSAMNKLSDSRMKLGTLAIHAGYMTASEVDELVIKQTHDNRRFGQLAVENGYLTEDQVMDLVKEQGPDFLLLGQILVDEGVLTNNDLEIIITDYKSDNEMIDLDMTSDQQENVAKLIDNLFKDRANVNPGNKLYFELLFNNLIRFVGEDFTPLAIEVIRAFPTDHCVKQQILGSGQITTYMSMDEATAIEFATRYAGDSFFEFDEYVEASLEDFLNLHNGLYVVNASNDESIELEIAPPEQIVEPILDFTSVTIHLPILYSFGTIHFIMEADL